MDKTVLIQYCDMKAEIKVIRAMIAKTEERLRRIEEEKEVADVVNGGLGGKQHFKVSGFPGDEHVRVKRLLKSRKERLKLKQEELLELTNAAEEYIESIESAEVRNMFRLYYIEGFTWKRVALEMNRNDKLIRLGKKKAYTEDACRMRNKRFFENV